MGIGESDKTRKIYPAVSDYIEALANPTGRFRTLDGLRPVTDQEGMPVYVTGSGGKVVFDVVTAKGQKRKLTCFTNGDPAGNKAGEELLETEIYAFNRNGEGDYYPVALREGVEPAHPEQVGLWPDEQGELREGRRIVVRDGLFGFEDAESNPVVEPRFAWAGDFEEGRAAVRSTQEQGGYYGLIDRDGMIVIPLEYDDLSWDGSRFAYVDRGGKYGCLDRSGNRTVEMEYDWMGEFSHGFAVVAKEGKYGYVDEAGDLVGEGLVYTDAMSVSADGTAEVVLPGGLHKVERFPISP